MRMAIPVPNIKALPTPCRSLKRISHSPEAERVQSSDPADIMSTPRVNIRFRPAISASLPAGSCKTAEERRKAMATQLMATADRPNSVLIEGSAMLTAAPIKGLKKEMSMTENRIMPLFEPVGIS